MATRALRSVIPDGHQRQQSSKDGGLESATCDALVDTTIPPLHLPPARPQLGDVSGNRASSRSSPRKMTAGDLDENKPLGDGARIKRSTSFKSLLPLKDISRSPIKSPRKNAKKSEEKPLQKSKSSSSLSALFSRPRSSKGTKTEAGAQREKENTTPPPTANLDQPPPIWAQFATTIADGVSDTRKVPLNDSEETQARYSSKQFSPSKPGNSYEHGQPVSASKVFPKARPKSESLTTDLSSTSLSETLSDLRRSGRNKGGPKIEQEELIQSLNIKPGIQNAGNEGRRSHVFVKRPGSSVSEISQLFNKKANALAEEPTKRPASSPLNSEAIEGAFETLLETRNVPLATRDKMRSLDTNIKADFIKQNKAVSSSSSTRDTPHNDEGTLEDSSEQRPAESPKKSRPRSLTFTLSKGDQSPTKRQRSGSHQRTKSGDVPPSASPKSSISTNSKHGVSFFSKTDKFALPEQIIAYLHKVRAPQSVEVGKVQKLRQLLRNETVGWVEAFVAQGGMTEVADLLYRIVAVEWREEHEDVLLHEVLLCLKALSTTSSAMAQISATHCTLFPTLLRMLFDSERKGPSEYSTRTIIINLLQSYLATSIMGTNSSRARILLDYLRDKSSPEETRAPEFICSIYHPRPYRIWHKELNNLTKEVFWIFLHHHNIIPYAPITSEPASSYQNRHFPKEHPPVAAAPYIGGVEWDATAYVTAHLDLLNGLIASLDTSAERNQLRQEMKDSGFEKLMGASFRTCKEKFYGSVHEALSVWVSAAEEDGWPDKDVRQGPPSREEVGRSPVKKGGKKKDLAPKLEMPRLDFGDARVDEGRDGGWL